MLSPTLDTFRTVLHLLGAAVWVGGQIAMAGVVPSLRRVVRWASWVRCSWVCS